MGTNKRRSNSSFKKFPEKERGENPQTSNDQELGGSRSNKKPRQQDGTIRHFSYH